MSIYSCQISLTCLTKIIHSSGDPLFDIIPSNNSNFTFCSFSIQKHQDNFTISSIKCKDGCSCQLDGNKLVLSFRCVLKHLIEVRVRKFVKAVIKAPHHHLMDENNVYKYQLPIPGFEDIKLDTEFKRFRDGTFGVWIINRWSIKMNGSFGNYFFNLYEDGNFVAVIDFEFDPDIVREQIATNTYRNASLQAISEMEAFQNALIESALNF
uniref:Uncharacterized protein n=1 Tax=Panagrolaimus sp. ES5 TaxID=591445 RepID=A0AC34FUU9_9BILA